MRVIARRTLVEFGERHSRAKSSLDTWFHEVRKADWSSPVDVRRHYRSADFVRDRVVFNVGGNNYRIVAAINYPARTVYIKFVGTHPEYECINAATVDFRRKT